MVDSKTAYRSFISAFNVTDSKRAFSAGYYVPMRRDSIAATIAARVEIQPDAQQAVVGGIGFGKTTQLLAAFDVAEAAGDTACVYVDVGQAQQLSALVPSLLLTLVAMNVAPLIAPEQESDALKAAIKEIEDHANGQYVPDYDDDYGDGYDGTSWKPGILKAPAPIASQVADIEEEVQAVVSHVGKPTVAFIDGLDRVLDMKKLIGLLSQDLRAFKRLGVGCVLVLPEPMLFGAERGFLDQLEWSPLLAMDVRKNKEHQDYFREVLAKRAPENLLTEEAIEGLIGFSGGVFRDLIVLARTAGVQAYLAGAPVIEAPHVADAAEQYGRKRLIGISKEQLATLQRVQKSGEFVETNDSDIALLTSGAVLQYPRPESRYEIHPTLVNLVRAKKRF